MIEQFMCFRVEEKANEKAPDYRLTAKVGEEWVEIGAGWVKEGAKGKFISFQMKKPYEDKKGYGIVAIASSGEATLPDNSKGKEDDFFGM